MSKQPKRSTRRRFLKSGAASIALASALAGCTGDGGDGGGGGGGGGGGDGGDGMDGGDGGDGGGDGGDGGGDGGDGGTVQPQELTAFNIVYPPWPGYPAFNYIHNQTDILSKELNDRGYEVGEVNITWDDTTLFMAGQVDFMPTAGEAESARMAMEREIDLTVHAQAATNYEGWYVREGSDLDPANSGGEVESMQMCIDNNDYTVGFAGWNQGSVWPNSALFYDKFDIKYGPDTNPPLNMQQADWFTLPSLLVDERVDIIVNAPPLGMNAVLAQDDPGVVDLLWQQPALEAAGLSPRTLNLGGFTTRTEFSENHEEAMVGWMAAWQQGVEWGRNPDNWEGILNKEDNWQYLVSENRKEAEINLKFSYAANPSEQDVLSTDNELPVILRDITLNDQRIQDSIESIEYMETTGALAGSGWRDYLSFKALSI